MNTKEIKQILDSGAGQSLKDFLQNQVDELDSLEALTAYPNAEEQALEFKSHKKALIIVKGILSQLMTFKTIEKPEKVNWNVL